MNCIETKKDAEIRRRRRKNVNRLKRIFISFVAVATANVLIFICYKRSSLYTNYKMHMKFLSFFLFHLAVLLFVAFFIFFFYSDTSSIKSEWCSLCFSKLLSNTQLGIWNDQRECKWNTIFIIENSYWVLLSFLEFEENNE